MAPERAGVATNVAPISDLPYHQHRNTAPRRPRQLAGVATDATAMTETVTTDQLFQTDSYLREFDARVVSVDPERHAVVLDRTAIYPGGGGQPADHGTLAFDGATVPVIGSKREGAGILHLIDPQSTLPPAGATVRGTVDWERRYALMRMHTALHVLCGVVFRDYGALVTGGNMEPDHARMDFEMDSAEFAPERVAEIGASANAEIAAAREIRVAIHPRAEAMRIPDLIRTKINLLPEGITEIRTVEIVGLDLQADGGTHVANTGEVGGIEITGTRSKGRINKRITIALTEPPTGA
jgi:misacylated tRNA(Ala) deacylase